MGRVSRELLVAIVTRRIAGPDDEIDVILYVLGNPFESAVDEAKGGVAVGRFSTIGTRGTLSAMASDAFFGRGVCLVELIGVEI
jgi:hypothetical protein